MTESVYLYYLLSIFRSV